MKPPAWMECQKTINYRVGISYGAGIIEAEFFWDLAIGPKALRK